MLTRSELPRNPVVLAVADPDGGRHAVTAERTRGGTIRMGCTCAASARQGWCRHLVDLLCLRYEAVPDRDEQAEFEFEDVVMGTPLADHADEVDAALAAFERARVALAADRAVRTDAEGLRALAALADDLGDASRRLERALERLRRRLAEAAA